jgi:hypothetical protein
MTWPGNDEQTVSITTVQCGGEIVSSSSTLVAANKRTELLKSIGLHEKSAAKQPKTDAPQINGPLILTSLTICLTSSWRST